MNSHAYNLAVRGTSRRHPMLAWSIHNVGCPCSFDETSRKGDVVT
jgi:hypothetical protein